MKEQFDKRLVDKIKDSFAHHEEPYDPAQWEKLSSAYFKPERKTARLIWPFITAGLAASLFLVLVYGPFGGGDALDDERLSEAAERKFEAEESGWESPALAGSDTLPTLRQFADEVNQQGEEDTKAQSRTPIRTNSAERSSPEDKLASVEKSDLETYEDRLAVQIEEDRPSGFELDQMLPKGDFVMPTDTLFNAAESRPAPMDVNEALQVLEKWMASGDEEATTPLAAKSNSPVKLGLVVAPQASSDAVNGMNLGAGVMSEFSLSRKLRLDVGMTYARQNLNADRSPSVVMASQASYAKADQMAMAENIRASSNFLGSSSQLSLASIDIPVNLKYLLLERKNAGVFLITGLSSMVYLDQAATETFETSSFFTSTSSGLNFAPTVEQFTSVYRPAGRSGADFGGMLNLSVGYEYNLKNGTFISLEPFYKLPLGDLTFVNQQFSVAGMNLRMNFNLRK
ncbi:outer membrane beta-barrel protein [Lunatimonas salinarum]|uniref:outer membrane beta-barrel protein n=1 Tax=Lunatimonas salinarum TaxID=1774590 RepID=UPI001AE0C421|nr:outer membrane beta-barrel protein [Lunatimonas salinarum]